MFPGFGRNELGVFILFSAKYEGESRFISFSPVKTKSKVSLSPQENLQIVGSKKISRFEINHGREVGAKKQFNFVNICYSF